MSNRPHPVSRFSRLRKLWKPAVASGAGGTTLAIWSEEIIAFAVEIYQRDRHIADGGADLSLQNLCFQVRHARVG